MREILVYDDYEIHKLGPADKKEYEEVTTEKATRIDVTDVAKPKGKLIPFGRTEQKQYTGKNLFNSVSYPVNETRKGVTITNNGDGSFTLNGTATEEVTFLLGRTNAIKEYGNTSNLVHTAYYVSGSITKVSSSASRTVIRLNYDTGTDKMISLGNLPTLGSLSKVFPQDTRDTGWNWGLILGVGDILDNFTIKYQLEKGSTATDYEPFVGRSTFTKSRFSTGY